MVTDAEITTETTTTMHIQLHSIRRDQWVRLALGYSPAFADEWLEYWQKRYDRQYYDDVRMVQVTTDTTVSWTVVS